MRKKPKKVLILDNYDSFTYNLFHYVSEITDAHVAVFRNDEIKVEELLAYDALIFSPGPGLPKEAGIMLEAIKKYYLKKPILGVCLGHQAIGLVLGGQLKNLNKVYHGQETPIQIVNSSATLFENVPNPFIAGRYHSWVIDKDRIPKELMITAKSAEGEIMAMQHRALPIFGVQFHPESIMTPYGKVIIANFLRQADIELKTSPSVVRVEGVKG